MVGIYKIENLITHQCYIGQSKFIERRWQDHKSRSKFGASKFYQAIRQYGLENFSWEVLEECSQEELDEKEIYWIEFYNSYLEGYNSTPGGQFQSTISNQLVYEAWDEGLSISQIAERLQIGKSTVYYILVGYNKYSTHESKRRGGIIACNTIKNEKRNKIFQYDLEGNFIAEWFSANERERQLGIDSDTIGRVINGKANKAGGFQWSDMKQDKIAPCKTPFSGVPRKIKQYSLDNIFLQEFESFASAARVVHGDSALLRRVVDKDNRTAYGYKWKSK